MAENAAPERVWLHYPQSMNTTSCCPNDVEYVRADLAAPDAAQPAAGTSTERATLDALVQMRHHDEHRQFPAATCPAWPCDVIREIRAAAAGTEAQESQVQCADCFAWIDRNASHTCRQQVSRNRRSKA